MVVTSYKDSSVGGVSNGDPNSVPAPGDYGGILLRNFSQAALPGSTTARTLRTLLPLHWFCSTLCMVAIKVVVF